MPVRTSPAQSYDPEHNILRVWHPQPVNLAEREDVVSHFDSIVGFWRGACAGRRAYYLVSWNGFTTNIAENRFYSQHVRRVVEECAILIVRFTYNPLRRAARHFAGLKLQVPSNVYSSEHDAVAAIELHRSQLRPA